MGFVEVIRAEEKSVGICETCVKNGKCQLRLSDKPVYECDDFDTGPSAEFNNESGKLSSEPAKVASGAKNGDLKGICSDCGEQCSCVRGKHTGGMWDCDSYMEINR